MCKVIMVIRMIMVTPVKGLLQILKVTIRIDLLVDRLVFRLTLLLISRLALLVKLSVALVLIPAIQHSSIPPLSKRFSHFYRNVSSLFFLFGLTYLVSHLFS